ncbi:FadR family transcriptional regulator [Cardiobacteriaceae bacterium TAE3-ERU3]|nr:FadR family transcriptional regulator [Cardiobacteriaceae bacterium TAE3-ERU3]
MQRIYKTIVHTIQQRIRQGDYPIGAPLPSERDLAKQLGVSRTSVREAIIALEVSGWVQVKLGSGVYVIADDSNASLSLDWPLDPEISPYLDNSQEEISPFSLLQARLLIEPESAALAAKSMDKAQLRAIKEAYLMNVQDNLQGSTTHIGDRLFHIRIAEASGNDAYAYFMRELLGHKYGKLFTTLQRLYTPEDMPMRSQQEHLAVLIALEARDSDAARHAMHEHLHNVMTMFMNAQNKNTDKAPNKAQDKAIQGT